MEFHFPSNKAYDDSIEICVKKIIDVKQIVKYIAEQQREFYTKILLWKTKSGTEDDQ